MKYFLLVLAIGGALAESEECEDKQDACRNDFGRKANEDKSREQNCNFVKEWRSCIERTIYEKNICVREFPQDLNNNETYYCYVEDTTSDCENKQTECRSEYESKVKDETSRPIICKFANEWRNCILKNIYGKGICEREFPQDLNNAEGFNRCNEVGKQEICNASLTKCREDWNEENKGNKQKKCDAARKWRQCINGEGDYCDTLTIPQDLKSAEEKCDKGTDTGKDKGCHASRKQCRDKGRQAIDQATDDVKKCNAATQWRQCINDQKDSCDKTIPQDLTDAESDNCKDETTAEEICDAAITQCNKEGRRAVNAATESDDKCIAARAWRQCINAQEDSCETLTFPEDLTQAESNNCPTSEEKCAAAITQCNEDGRRAVNAATESDDKCIAARAWRQCINDQKDSCETLTFPEDLTQAESNNCPTSEEKCDAAIMQCNADGRKAVSLATASDDKCNEASAWRQCINNQKDSCETLTFPDDLTQAESNNCPTSDQTPACTKELETCNSEGRQAVSDAKGDVSQQCSAEKTWRQCINQRTASCDPPTFPSELKKTPSRQCKMRSSTDK